MFKSKVTALKASKTRIYPSIRLPREYGEIVGSNANIIPTSHEGKQAFLVVIDKESLNAESLSPLEQKLVELENEIADLKETVYGEKASEYPKKSKEGSPARTTSQRYIVLNNVNIIDDSQCR